MSKVINLNEVRDNKNEERRKNARVQILGDLVMISVKIGGNWDFFKIENISESGFALRVSPQFTLPDEMTSFRGRLYLGTEYFIPISAEFVRISNQIEDGTTFQRVSFQAEPSEEVQGVLRALMELVEKFALNSISGERLRA